MKTYSRKRKSRVTESPKFIRLWSPDASEMFVLVLFIFLLFGASHVWGAGGDVVWEDQFDRGGGDNRSFDVTAWGPLVFAAGNGLTSDNKLEWIVQAYFAGTGKLLWKDQLDKGGGVNDAYAITMKWPRVYAAGNGSTSDGKQEWVVRAYHPLTGRVLWEDQFGKDGTFGTAGAIAATRSRVFAAGFGLTADERVVEWLVRAYEAKSGKLLWVDELDRGGRLSHARAIAVKGSKVFVAGDSRSSHGVVDWVVRAYDARTGKRLWQDFFDKGGRSNHALAIAVRGSRVFVVGDCRALNREVDWLVRAYDSKTGTLLWEDQVNKGGESNHARALAVRGSRVFVVGDGHTANGEVDWLVRAYDASTGALLWEDQLDKGGAINVALSIAADWSKVYVAGQATTSDGTAHWLVRAYDAKSGKLRWEDQLTRGGSNDRALSIARSWFRVVAAGEAHTAYGDIDWLVRAYKTR